MTQTDRQPDLQPADKPVYPQAALPSREAVGRRVRAGSHWLHWLKWGDYLLYGLIGGTALLLLWLLPGLASGSGHVEAAIVSVDQEQVMHLSAADLQQGGEKAISANGYHYVLAWEEGRIRVAEADCPDKVCVHTGWISRVNDIAACVPGHLIVKIVGSPEPDQPDVIVR